MTTFGFIRHGVTDWNKEKRAQGQIDIPLNSDGLRQAEILAMRLRNEPWDLIVASNLSRAGVTASVIASHTGLALRTDERLRERNFGQMEGTTIDERIRAWGPDWQSRDMGMEERSAVIERGMSLIGELTEQYPNGRILLVSHIAFIQIMLQALAPDFEQLTPIDNTSITVVDQQISGWTCSLYNCSAHLQTSR